MATELPPQLQDQLAQLQNLQVQLQVAMQQRQQFEFQLKDMERALEELESLGANDPVYRTVGGLLIRTAGRDAVQKKIAEERETTEVRLKSLEKQEARLKEKATELQSKVQAAVKNLGGAPGAPAKAPPRKS